MNQLFTKQLLIKILTAAAVLSASVLDVFGQTRLGEEPLRPSSDVWETIKYGEVSPTLYTGTINLSIPFYTYKDNDFEIPVSFSYASNGCHPNDRAGALGVGWMLDAGGCISREIRGVPDDETGLLDFGNISGDTYTALGFSYLGEAEFSLDDESLYAVGPTGPVNAQCVYYGNSTFDFFDAEPDVYHFNFGGYSGSFILDMEGNAVVFDTNTNPNNFNIVCDFSLSPVLNKITIKMDDGYRYEFDGTKGGPSINVDYTEINNTPIILCWKLSRIIAPNGRTVSFTYNLGHTVVNYRPNTSTYTVISDMWSGDLMTKTSGEKSHKASSIRVANLSSISVDGEPVITLSYDTSVIEKWYSTTTESASQSSNAFGNYRLTSVSVVRGYSNIKTANFIYDTNNPSQRAYLTSLTISGEGTYHMEYYNTTSVPLYGTFKLDHWDFYNGRSSSASEFLKVSSLYNDDKDEQYISNNVRTPNANYAKCGMLTSITYPTGGYSTFTYNAHTYAKAVKRTSANGFEPELFSESGTAGGLRLSSVSNYSTDGELLSRKEYSYTKQDGSCSGILLDFPRYKVNVASWSDLYAMSCNCYLWSNNLTNYGNTHMEYSEVLETSLDGSSVRYLFTTSEDYPDDVIINDYYSQRIIDNIDNDDSWSPNRFSIENLFANTSFQSLRGRLTGQILYDAGGAVVASNVIQYEELSDDKYVYTPSYLCFMLGMVGTYTGREEISSMTESTVFGNKSVSMTTEKEYNDYMQLKSETREDSQGVKTIVRYKYVTDYSFGRYAEMKSKGLINFPAEFSTYTKVGSGPEALVSTTAY